MGSSRFWLKVADEENKSIPHEFPRSHWLKATGQCVKERYLSATMEVMKSFPRSLVLDSHHQNFLINWLIFMKIVAKRKKILNKCMLK